MATATPEKPPSPSPSPTTTTTPSTMDQTKFLHNAAVAGLVICPAIILLPPRKFDVYTVALLAGTVVSANHLTYHYSGRSFTTRWSDRFRSFASGGELPPKAVIMQERLRREREARDRKLGVQLTGEKLGGSASTTVEQVESKVQEGKGRSILERVWYGQEGEDWKRKRDEREKKALEEGKGYSDLIMDQIWEVWNGAKAAEEDKEPDEKEKEEGKK